MNEIVLATRNAHKVQELRELLSGMPVRVLSLSDFPPFPEPEETGATFAENAEIKSRAAADATGMTALADDSGLEVDALGGQPGVYSSRFGGPGATDRDKYLMVLDLLKDVPDDQRTARFRAAVAIARPGGDVILVEGTCEGRIAHEPRGDQGFGYDPIFLIPELGKTMAELSSDEKNQISHRARAMQAARDVLREWSGGSG